MVISWKELSSTTAQSVGRMLSASASRGCPILPPRWTVCPAASSSLAIMVVVVVFPSLPVTAMIGQGQTRKNTSISDVISLPRAFASSKNLGCRPGVRKITSWSRPAR